MYNSFNSFKPDSQIKDRFPIEPDTPDFQFLQAGFKTPSTHNFTSIYQPFNSFKPDSNTSKYMRIGIMKVDFQFLQAGFNVGRNGEVLVAVLNFQFLQAGFPACR